MQRVTFAGVMAILAAMLLGICGCDKEVHEVRFGKTLHSVLPR